MWWDGKANEGVQHRINPKYEELGSTLVSIEQVTRVSQNNHSASEQKKRECTETALVIVGLGVKPLSVSHRSWQPNDAAATGSKGSVAVQPNIAE
jgi:hypothetical protein